LASEIFNIKNRRVRRIAVVAFKTESDLAKVTTDVGQKSGSEKKMKALRAA
jgi:hypothetical protein